MNAFFKSRKTPQTEELESRREWIEWVEKRRAEVVDLLGTKPN